MQHQVIETFVLGLFFCVHVNEQVSKTLPNFIQDHFRWNMVRNGVCGLVCLELWPSEKLKLLPCLSLSTHVSSHERCRDTYFRTTRNMGKKVSDRTQEPARQIENLPD